MPVTCATRNKEQARTLAKRIVWLAYQAAIPVGMGKLQYREDLNEDQVWKQCGLDREEDSPKTIVAADYLVGRMMKLYLAFDEAGVASNGFGPAPDYQSWCTVYKTYEELFSAAEQSLAVIN